MRLAIEDGLLMVFGPERDPVPPHAFAAAAAAHPDAPLALPDGTAAPASRVAAVLGAQALGRLGKPEQGNAWILAMLREGGGPKPASEDRLRAEQHALSVVELNPEEPALTGLDAEASYLDAEDNVPDDAGEDARADAAADLAAGDPGGSEPGPVRDRGAGPADDVASPAGLRMIVLDLNPPALAGEAFDALVIRDLPAGALLSAGAYDPAIDGWVLRSQDLGGLAVLSPPELRADFTVTLLGIALRPGEANTARVLARLPVRVA
jgi:hypothetical protein